MAHLRRLLGLAQPRQWVIPISAALSLTLSSAGFATRAPLVLEPSSAWAASFVKGACHLARAFGEGDEKITIDFRQYGPSPFITLVASGKSLDHGKQSALVTQFLPNGTPHEDLAALMVKRHNGFGLIETITSLAPKSSDAATREKKLRDWQPDPAESVAMLYDRQAEGRITALRLSGSVAPDVVLELGRMDLPMDAMRLCLDEQMTRWGIDPAAYYGLSRRVAPSTNPGAWVFPSDYPTGMLRGGRIGTVDFRLMIDETGRPTACIAHSSAGDDFDKITCDVMLRRARFSPALDAGGRAVASFYVNAVRWRIP